MQELQGHCGPLAFNRCLPRLSKMNFDEVVIFPADFQPEVVRELDQDPITIAVVQDVEVSGLIVEFEKVADGQWFRIHKVNWALHFARLANSGPIVGSLRS